MKYKITAKNLDTDCIKAFNDSYHKSIRVISKDCFNVQDLNLYLVSNDAGVEILAFSLLNIFNCFNLKDYSIMLNRLKLSGVLIVLEDTGNFTSIDGLRLILSFTRTEKRNEYIKLFYEKIEPGVQNMLAKINNNAPQAGACNNKDLLSFINQAFITYLQLDKDFSIESVKLDPSNNNQFKFNVKRFENEEDFSGHFISKKAIKYVLNKVFGD